MTRPTVARIMRERDQEKRIVSAVIPPSVPMAKRIAKFDARSIGTVADAPAGPDSRAFLEIAHNGVVSIGMELAGWVDPFHVRRRIATRFYFRPSAMLAVSTWIQSREFAALWDRLVHDHCVIFHDGHVQAWIRADGMQAHDLIACALRDLERNHVGRPPEPATPERPTAPEGARDPERNEAATLQAPRSGGVRLFGRRASLHGSGAAQVLEG